jgi:hypothetical protein
MAENADLNILFVLVFCICGLQIATIYYGNLYHKSVVALSVLIPEVAPPSDNERLIIIIPENAEAINEDNTFSIGSPPEESYAPPITAIAQPSYDV